MNSNPSNKVLLTKKLKTEEKMNLDDPEVQDALLQLRNFNHGKVGAPKFGLTFKAIGELTGFFHVHISKWFKKMEAKYMEK